MPRETDLLRVKLDVYKRQMRRGADAHGAYPDSLAISQNWSVAAQGSDVPVYAVPVTR